MSKANGAIEKKDTFLQHVSLKNYKSIKNIEIDFKPGLNIIIGKNSSGKTNFINGLNDILNSNYEKLVDSESSIIVWFKEDKIEITASNKNLNIEEVSVDDYRNDLITHKLLLTVNNYEININDRDNLKDSLFFEKYFFDPIFIKYGINYNERSEFVNVPFSFSIINNGKISRELMIDNNKQRTEFVQILFHGLYIKIFRSLRFKKGIVSSKYLKEEITVYCQQYFEKINNVINIYSPIKTIRINKNFNLVVEELNQKQTITNFYLEFLIDQTWFTYNLLSDGTKRLFYILSEIIYAHSNDNPIVVENEDLNVVFLEEPELGIHPHQLHQLMQFIKEQSKEKQIILTTHSPQVLDALEPAELDRIIICHSDPKNGTQLSHLTDQQIKKAKKYMTSEAFLSDYWRFSDLEPA